MNTSFSRVVPCTRASTPDDCRIYWQKRAALLTARINAGWWLLRFSSAGVPMCLLAAIAIVAARAGHFPLAPLLLISLTGLAAAALWAWLRSRRDFIPIAAAYARLDASESLFNRLSSAANGIGNWPPIPDSPPHPTAWRLPRILAPLASGLAALLLALAIPVRLPADEKPFVVREPTDWRAVEQAVEWLREEETVQEAALERLEARLESLREQPPETWYRQSSLEAAAHLRDQVASAAWQLDMALARAEAALSLAAEQAATLTDPQRAELQKMLQQALEGLEKGTLPLDPDLLRELQKMDLSRLPHITEEELKKLTDKLCEQGKCLKKCAAVCQGGAPERGPGVAPMTLAEHPLPPPPTEPMPLSNPDLRHAALGDQIGLSDGRHEVDESSWSGPQETASPAHQGGGGEAVFRMPVPPREQAVLKQYFN